MLDLSHPWWEFVVRAIVVYLVLLVFVRLSGKRTVGQFTPFDLLVVMLMSEAVSNSLSGGDESLIGGLVVALVLVLLNLLMAYVTTRTRKAEDVIEGSPVLIARDGQLFPDVLRRHRLGQGEWEQSLREADAEMHEVRRAFLEADGTISILKTKAARKAEEQG
jgi:uncharacterized membrane protein YcaP (DUF421 family)